MVDRHLDSGKARVYLRSSAVQSVVGSRVPLDLEDVKHLVGQKLPSATSTTNFRQIDCFHATREALELSQSSQLAHSQRPSPR